MATTTVAYSEVAKKLEGSQPITIAQARAVAEALQRTVKPVGGLNGLQVVGRENDLFQRGKAVLDDWAQASKHALSGHDLPEGSIVVASGLPEPVWSKHESVPTWKASWQRSPTRLMWCRVLAHRSQSLPAVKPGRDVRSFLVVVKGSIIGGPLGERMKVGSIVEDREHPFPFARMGTSDAHVVLLSFRIKSENAPTPVQEKVEEAPTVAEEPASSAAAFVDIRPATIRPVVTPGTLATIRTPTNTPAVPTAVPLGPVPLASSGVPPPRPRGRGKKRRGRPAAAAAAAAAAAVVPSPVRPERTSADKMLLMMQKIMIKVSEIQKDNNRMLQEMVLLRKEMVPRRDQDSLLLPLPASPPRDQVVPPNRGHELPSSNDSILGLARGVGSGMAPGPPPAKRATPSSRSLAAPEAPKTQHADNSVLGYLKSIRE